MATTHTLAPHADSTRRESSAVRMAWSWNGILIRLALLAVIVAAIWLGLLPLKAAPAVVPASAPAGRFSAERAMAHVEALAASPRPIGSPQQAAARDYLVGQISALGLEPVVQRTTVARGSGEAASVAAVENVMVRLPGREDGRAVLITGHYDSVPTSPGAYDCANCAATVLETLRVLKAGPQLKNDVIFLFTDGEEVETMGAEAFVGQHPWARDVALALVYEGYGSTGADVLYYTGEGAGRWSARAMGMGATGYSFMNDIMGMIGGSSSDLESFLHARIPGLAFIAFSLENAPGYHTWDDNVANFDPRTLQSHGDRAVALVGGFGNMELSDAPRETSPVYFSLLPGLTVHYPGGLALPLAAAGLLLYLSVVVLGVIRGRLNLLAVLAGASGWLLSLLLSLSLVTAMWVFLRRLNPNLHAFRIGVYDVELYLLAFVALSAAITWAIYALARRRFQPGDLAAGALGWWAVFGLLLALVVPGASYVCTWPLLAALSVAAWCTFRPGRSRAAGAFAWLLPSAVGLVLATPLIYFLAVLANRLEGAMAWPVPALPLPFALLLLGLSLPLAELVASRRRIWLAGSALGLCLALLLVATLRSAPSTARPGTDAVMYRLETAGVSGDRAAADRASWITLNDPRGGRGTRTALDSWTSQFFPAGATEETTVNPFGEAQMAAAYPALQTAAPLPAAPLPRGAINVEEDTRSAGLRHLRLHLALAPRALDRKVLLSAGGPLAGVTVNGQPVDLSGTTSDTVQLNISGRFPDGITLALNLPAEAALTVGLTERTLGLPDIPGLAVQPRPATLIPAPFNAVADSTLVAQSWRLNP